MSNPQWRDRRPSRPYGGEPGGGRRGRDTPGPSGDPRAPRRDPGDDAEPTRGWGDQRLDPRLGGAQGDDAATRRMPAQADLTQPVARQPAGTSRRRRAAGRRPRGAGGRLSRIWEGSLRGGLGVFVILCSAVIGAVATIATHAQPGAVLGLAVLAGTVAAALTVQPRTGRLIFPVPALSYLIAAVASGVAYDRSTDKTELAVGAAQWIANGFFVMVLATLLAIALTTVRWYMWRRDQRGPAAPDWPVPPRPSASPRRAQAGPPRPPAGQPGTPGPRPGTQPTRWPSSAGPRDQRPGPRPDQRPRPGSGPYNFSSGA
jgi:hypothetical protein